MRTLLIVFLSLIFDILILKYVSLECFIRQLHLSELHSLEREFTECRMSQMDRRPFIWM